MKGLLLISSLGMIFLLMAACSHDSSVPGSPDAMALLTAPGPNPMINQPDALGRVARAGAGLWHGLIAPITLILSFFDANVHMYEVHNAGSEYDLGFLLGVALILSLLGLFIRMRR